MDSSLFDNWGVQSLKFKVSWGESRVKSTKNEIVRKYDTVYVGRVIYRGGTRSISQRAAETQRNILYIRLFK